MSNLNEIVWAEKYRPQTIEECILPNSIKNVFIPLMQTEEVPNLLLSGRAGIGKTTVAKAFLNQIGADYIVINGSMNGNIDTLRVDITNFATSVSFDGNRKFVILDEADYLNANSTQPALRNFMEEYSKNCGFILTCNFKNRIIEPLQSRCSNIEFKIDKSERAQIAAKFYKRACYILDQENVPYVPAAVASVVQKHFPDWRRVLNELQAYSKTGKIDEGILVNRGTENIEVLVNILKEKRFDDMRIWVAENIDMDASSFYRQLYDIFPLKMSSAASVAGAIISLAEYQYREAFVADSEINRVAALSVIMAESSWK